MKKIIQLRTDDGNEVLIEVSDVATVDTFRSGANPDRGVVDNIKDSFDKALAPLKGIANSIINTIKDIANAPDEVSAELGFKFSAKAGIILTSLDSEANFKIALKWTKEKAPKEANKPGDTNAG